MEGFIDLLKQHYSIKYTIQINVNNDHIDQNENNHDYDDDHPLGHLYKDSTMIDDNADCWQW